MSFGRGFSTGSSPFGVCVCVCVFLGGMVHTLTPNLFFAGWNCTMIVIEYSRWLTEGNAIGATSRFT